VQLWRWEDVKSSDEDARIDVVEDCVRKVDEKIENIRDSIMSEMNKAFEKVNKNIRI